MVDAIASIPRLARGDRQNRILPRARVAMKQKVRHRARTLRIARAYLSILDLPLMAWDDGIDYGLRAYNPMVIAERVRTT